MEWILLDEAQDSDELQFDFIFKRINPDFFFVCGDIKQSIYQWKGSNPKLMMDLARRDDVQFFDMNENYRNGFNILSYAKKLIKPTGLIDNSISKRIGNGSVTEVTFSDEMIVSKLQQGEYKDWAILSRTNKDVNQVAAILKKHNIPFDTFRQGDLTRDELLTKMNQNTVKVLTIHSAKGLEWDNVIAIGMRYNSDEERNVCYVAATRAKENLYWTLPKSKRKPVSKVKTYQW